MKTDQYMYLKLCESTLPEQKDLVEHNGEMNLPEGT